VAIIMDGNGRWARSRGLPRLAGHHAGAGSVRKVVESAPDLGVKILTLYAFSSDNWKRPVGEVRGLMRLFRAHLASETPELQKNGVRLRVIGRRDRLPTQVLEAIDKAECATARGRRLELRVAVDYSSRDSLLAAIRQARSPEAATRAGFERVLGAVMNLPEATSDVDLLIRTGGEQRLSDFMLWECCYAEMLFSPKRWPEFSGADLGAAVAEFQRRERRFGAVPVVQEEMPQPSRAEVEEEEEIEAAVGREAEESETPPAYVAAENS
jgi:undecaprenyl diphosphate synthase